MLLLNFTYPLRCPRVPRLNTTDLDNSWTVCLTATKTEPLIIDSVTLISTRVYPKVSGQIR
jgi:hypothetical protein